MMVTQRTVRTAQGPQVSTSTQNSTAQIPSGTTALVVMGGAMLALFLGVMDQSIVSTAGQTIISELGGYSLYTWVFSAFVLAQTVSMPVFGRLSDSYGRKKFFLMGLIIFMIGSVLSGAAQNIQQLVAFRALQGLGSGAFFSIGLAIIGSSVPPEKRSRILGITGGIFVSGAIMGPTVGSYIVQSIGWRWIFYVNIPLSIISLLLIGLRLRESRSDVKHSVDWLGVGTLAGWVSFLLLGFLNGGTTYPWYSWEEAFFFAGFTVLFPIFLLVETRSAEPILPLRLFKNRTISSVFIVQFLRGGILLGLIVFISVFVQGALRGTIDDVRNVIWAFVIPAAVGSIFSGRIVSRFGYRIVTLSGLILTAVGGYFLATIGATPSVFDAIIRAPLMGLGLGISIASVLSAFQNSVERRDIGIASSLSTFSQNLGGAVVVGILGTIQLNSLTSRLASMAATPQLRQAALEGSITDVFLALFIMTLIAALASLFVSNPKKAQS